MAYLATLEGEVLDDSQIIDRLFDCNDSLGVMVYGPELWAKVKNYVANMASKAIAENRGKLGTWARQHYKSNGDVLDVCFGFNDSLGCALLGGEGWGHFVNGCKLAGPTLGWNPISSLLVNPTKSALRNILPKDTSAKGLLKWASGYNLTKDSIQDWTGATDEKKQAAAQQEAYKKELEQQQIAYQQAAEQAEADRQNTLAIEAAKAEAAATGAYKTARDTDPNYLRSQTNNVLIFGAVALAAVIILGGRK